VAALDTRAARRASRNGAAAQARSPARPGPDSVGAKATKQPPNNGAGWPLGGHRQGRASISAEPSLGCDQTFALRYRTARTGAG
jgi:hypothetical protein